ncbi:Zn-ribbon domain-containing OB-fold protein [Mycolicibacterium sp. PDY-3]|uniref:Zn-ribbon domain-containing OB-fold protein n=1 Tax=Mycolicibacterium sp. PDY-3 TaxID=3376069 RepID=UPI00378DB1E6
MTDPMVRPLPLPTPTSAPYWDGLRRHEVWVQYSPSSDAYVFYPRTLAPGTLADDLQWRQISGDATLVSFAVAQRPVAPQFADAVPHLLGVVQWTEGPRLATEIVGVDPARLRIGMAMTPVFTEPDGADITLLHYTAAE